MPKSTLDELIAKYSKLTHAYEDKFSKDVLEQAHKENRLNEYWEHKDVLIYLKQLKEILTYMPK